MSAVILDEEIIAWTSVDDRLPDDDVTVLVCAPGADEPVWLGYYDGCYWFAIGGEEYGNAEEFPQVVTAWAPMPKGAHADIDPTPWCSGCGSMTRSGCHCGPIAQDD